MRVGERTAWPLGILLLVLVGLAVIYRFPRVLWYPMFADTLTPEDGHLQVPGLGKPVTVRRDKLGIPVIEAASTSDLAFATGWVMAQDRIAQMTSFSLIAQGRLAEMAGPVALPMDEYMRALDLDGAARKLLASEPPAMRQLLQRFSDGVNAWVHMHRDRLPMGLALAGYRPEPWTPLDSLRVYTVLTEGLSVNVQEELAFLAAAKRVGVHKAAWLFPIYPDEPLPFAEADKLKGVDLSQVPTSPVLDAVAATTRVWSQGLAASNNWVIAGSHTVSGRPILANDTHLMLSQPPLWMLLEMRCPQYKVGGIAIAGIPGIVAGSNGKVAWGMTMVMADTQDLFLEKTRRREGKLEYLYQGQWLPATARQETFHVKDGATLTKTLWSTRHGPLLNGLVGDSAVNRLQPIAAPSSYGLALKDALQVPDQTLDAIFRLGQAQNFDEAQAQIRRIRSIPLNMVFADAQHIGWQVTGRYPVRKHGTGQLPSPGWTGEYDWTGFAPDALRPHEEDPATGFIATANHRTVKGGPIHLSSSWYYPERFERIQQVLSEPHLHDADETLKLQFDRHDLLVPTVDRMLSQPAMAKALDAAIARLPEAQAASARRTLKVLLGFDGDMLPESTAASRFGVFEYLFVRGLFLDELGPDTSPAWRALMEVSGITYSAEEDHLRGRDDSPFWDDVRTPQKETKADILARALAGTEPYLAKHLGRSPAEWAWGRFHTYTWESGTTQFAAHMPPFEAALARWVGRFQDRGPYPAGGDRNTVNVAGYTTGENFHVWDIPAMRLMVDFGAKEPLHVINSGGQSGNPLSPHYDDGIPVWLHEGTRPMPLKTADIDKQYTHVMTLSP
ncbi:penicillin acylase family protein [Mangrovitalea sediminis]|uniref:penicillin acylase family protein n=1 Tax=Mangrovitalea sediminis TaxID=1982043 RepID=UPI000BE60BA9|nr:penicillin acylase family protein [Mangrovitalea sediminis]